MLSEKLKGIREKSGLSQIYFAELIGVSTSAIYAYETGRQAPSANVIRKVCTQFNVSADWLLDLTNVVCRGCGEIYEPEKYSYQLKFCSRCGGELWRQDGHHQQG